ncbi:hypothetical protein GCM10009721_34360 [Terrabacter tumescens]|uniref:Glycosyltransferase RgtA/B/C/D-like domain-containing protein n=1 Tax=Terrabacter tumescens TaxID=60443 RepID=A0ABQ2I930_9MICO|nr:hypothetical protein GCM10009721_34360 [Terrabacter tumescens]
MGCAVTAFVFWPGYLSYDSLWQLQQARGDVALSDWHPPAMSLLWRALTTVTGSEASLALGQSVALWSALGLIAFVVSRATSRLWTGLAVLAIGLFPPVLTITGVVWKDVQMALALLLAIALTAVVVYRRPSSTPVRLVIFAAAIILLAYATIVRKNAVFAIIPLLVLVTVVFWPARGWKRWVVTVVSFALAVAVPTALIEFVAKPTKTSQVTQIFIDDIINVVPSKELAAADVRSDVRSKLVRAQEVCRAKDSVVNSYWTCYGQGADGPFTAVANPGEIQRLWMAEMPSHLPGYVQYRARLFVDLLFATRQPYQEGVLSNDLGINVAHPQAERALASYVTGMRRDVPVLFSGWFWLLVCLGIALVPGRHRWTWVVRACGWSGALYILGYAPVVPATDFRYVYWSVVAGTLGLTLALVARRTDPASATPPERGEGRQVDPTRGADEDDRNGWHDGRHADPLPRPAAPR